MDAITSFVIGKALVTKIANEDGLVFFIRMKSQ